MDSEYVILIMVGVSLTLYAVLGGADFGAGIWEFNTVLLAPEKERKLIYGAIGPVWEANHVWLIFLIVLLFTGFPSAVATLARELWVPLLLALVGIVFRGAAYALRSHFGGRTRQQAAWGAVFAMASTATPFFLGGCIGAVASGQLVGSTARNELTGWLNPLAIYSSLMAVGLCAYLAAMYLTREASQIGDVELTEIWRRRALSTGLWMGILAAMGLVLVAVDAPALWAGLKGRAGPVVLTSLVMGVGSMAGLVGKSYTVASLAAAGAVTMVLWGWLIAQYPLLIPPHITVENAKAPNAVLRAMAWSVAAGAVILAPSLAWLLYLFKGKRPDHG